MKWSSLEDLGIFQRIKELKEDLEKRKTKKVWMRILSILSNEFEISDNIDAESLRSYYKRARKERGDISEKKQKVEDYTVDALLKENKNLKEKVHKQNSLMHLIDKVCEEKVNRIILPPVKPGKLIEKSKHDDYMVALFSDLQYGQIVNADFTSNLGSYNPDIAKERIVKYFDKIIEFKKDDEGVHGLNTLVLISLGDILEGVVVYPGQVFRVIPVVIDTILEFSIFLADQKRRLASYFTKIVEYTVNGQHGRMGKNKGDYDERDNLDYLLYVMVKRELARQENYKCFISKCPIMMLQLGDFDIAISHGDAVKSHMGIPWYGLERYYRNLNVMANKVFRYAFVADKHRSFQAEHLTMNGTFVGGNSLSVNKMIAPSISSQRVFLYNIHHGIHRSTDVYLTEKPVLDLKLKDDGSSLYTEYYEGH